MPLTLTLTAVVAFSFLVSRLLQRYAPQRLNSPTAYLVVGILVGPEGGNLVSPQDLVLLQPFISLTLGVVGFVLGLPLAKRLESVEVIEVGLLTTIVTIIGLTASSQAILQLLHPVDVSRMPALTLGAAGAATSLTNLRAAAIRFAAHGTVTQLVQSLALVGNVLAVVISGLAIAMADVDASAAQLGLPHAVWLLANIVLGLACGLLFHFFVQAEDSDERAFLGTVGIIFFTSGIASTMGISSLVLNVLAGVVVAITPKQPHSRHIRLEPLRRPTFIVLYILAGAIWRPAGWISVLAPLVFYSLRFITLRIASALAVRVVPRVEIVSRIGQGLMPMGGVAIAIGVNYNQVNLPASDTVLSAILGAVVLAELLSIRGLRQLWIDSGEISDLSQRVGARK
ncbi:MAG: hypothetical protein KTR25_03690 [Myxococcales bacterium]|nr:hypothetical protein [Myxococcales bacterium]